jgi:hypothetical protein
MQVSRSSRVPVFDEAIIKLTLAVDEAIPVFRHLQNTFEEEIKPIRWHISQAIIDSSWESRLGIKKPNRPHPKADNEVQTPKQHASKWNDQREAGQTCSHKARDSSAGSRSRDETCN